MKTDENPSPNHYAETLRTIADNALHSGKQTHEACGLTCAEAKLTAGEINRLNAELLSKDAEIERLRGIEQRAIEWAKADADYRDHDEGEGRTIDLDTGDRLWRARREAAGRLFEAVGQPYYSGTLETGGSSENA